MTDGPSKPAPNYKNMWQNYSQWLIDARSRFEQTSALSRAKQAAAGFRATGTDSGATRRKAEQEHFSSEAERIRQGYTSEQLRRAYVINTQQTGFPFKRSTQKTYKLLESPEDVPTVSYRVGQGGGIPTRDDFEQDRVRLKTVPLYEHMGKTKDQYTEAFNKFQNLFGRNPDQAEIYYAMRYGLPGPSDAPSEEELSLTKAKTAAGKAGSSRQKAAMTIGAKQKEDEKSPWV